MEALISLCLSPDSLLTKSQVLFVVHEGLILINLHSGLTLVGTALSPAGGPRGYNRDSVASPTVAVRGPFSSYLCDDRDKGHSYDTIDSHYSSLCKALLFVILQCNIKLMEENSLPGIVLTCANQI